SAPLQTGQSPPVFQYLTALLTRGKLNASGSLQVSGLVNQENLLDGYKLGNLVK
ncbi:hypothetical protein MKW92_049412, partial [Papaver armeniacum]